MLWVMLNNHHRKLLDVVSKFHNMMEELVQQLTIIMRQQLVAVTYHVLSRWDNDGYLSRVEMGNTFIRECWQVNIKRMMRL